MAIFIIIPAVALLASFLTLISGFGLGTIMLPVFAIFFDLPLAVALTAVVHLLNNVFKTGILWGNIHFKTFALFGIPGILGAYFGAKSLNYLSEKVVFFEGQLDSGINLLNLVLGVLMILFALTELFPNHKLFSFKGNNLLLGGVLSGFFGGLSGHQGALRSVFLLKTPLTKNQFIGTGVAIALLVDLIRIPVYLQNFKLESLYEQWPLLVTSVFAAFAGAYVGKNYIEKVKMKVVQQFVGWGMIGIGVMIIFGI